jgi:ribosomal protein S18 acetylase RimI-like enzyme
MMTPYRIRSAQTSDADAIAAVFLASWRALMPMIPLVHSDAEVRAWIGDVVLHKGEVTVSIQGDEVVAMMAASRGESGGWIDHLYVAPEHAGRGVGSALARVAIATLPRPIRLYTFQANERARSFYERLGFRAAAFGDGSGNEEGCPDVLYQLD